MVAGTYYWQVRAINGGGTQYGNGSYNQWWSFTVANVPGAFSKVSPANGNTNVSPNPTLSWGASSGATLYEYCINTTTTCTTRVSIGTNLSVALSGLIPNTYYWQVRASNVGGTTYANGISTATWSFVVRPLPGAFSKISPVNGATGQPTNPTLTWQASAGATSYGYCINTTGGLCNTWISTLAIPA